jgi:hypothetical protein
MTSGNGLGVARTLSGNSAAILVRDSKDQAGPVLSFTADTWTGFVRGIKVGQFDR